MSLTRYNSISSISFVRMPRRPLADVIVSANSTLGQKLNRGQRHGAVRVALGGSNLAIAGHARPRAAGGVQKHDTLIRSRWCETCAQKSPPPGGLRSGRETLTGGRSAPGLCPHEGHDGLPDRLVEELPHAHHLGKLGIVAQAQRKRLNVGLGRIAGSDLLRRFWRLLFGGVAPVS